MLRFAPLSRGQASVPSDEVILWEAPVMDRQQTLGAALDALAKIGGADAVPEIAPFLRAGVEREGLPLEVYEKLAPLRPLAVRALARCGPLARPLLERAAEDPVDWVAREARAALE